MPTWHTDALQYLVSKPDVANAAAAIGSAIVATIAALISFISIVVSVATLRHQRKHNQLSVLPLAYVMLGDYEDCLYVKVRNNGTGPMIVKAIEIHGADSPFAPLIAGMPEPPKSVNWTNFVEEYEERSIAAGGEMVLLELSSESSTSEVQFKKFRDKVRLALGKLRIRVTYTDIYGDAMPDANRDLKFFLRLVT